MSETRYIHSKDGFKKDEYTLDESVEGNEILIRPLRMLICASDLHHMKAHPEMELTLGHEYVARVEKAGSEAKLKTGDLITSTACLACGTCTQCKIGMTNYCENPEWLGFGEKGALSTLIKVRDHQVATIPNETPLNEAALFEVASIGYEAVRLLLDISSDKIKTNSKKLIVTGAGPVGLFCALAGKKQGLEVTLLEKVPSRIKRAQELGFDCLSLQEVLIAKEHHHQFDMIIDASGDAHGEGALNFAPFLGKLRFNLIVVGKYLEDPGLNLATLNNFGATIKYMRGTPLSSLQTVIDEWKNDIRDWEPKLISNEFDFDKVNEAYQSTSDLNSTCKVLIKVQD